MEKSHFYDFSSKFRNFTSFNMSHSSQTVEFCMLYVTLQSSRLICNGKHELHQIIQRCAWFFCLESTPSRDFYFYKKRLFWSTFRLKNHIDPVSDILYSLEKDKWFIWNQVMLISYVLDKGICDIFSFSVAKPADFVSFRQAYMYQHENAYVSAHIQNRLLLWVFIYF